MYVTDNNFTEALNSGEQTNALFLDVSKAFNKEKLYFKLSHSGINRSLLDWIKVFMGTMSNSNY